MVEGSRFSIGTELSIMSFATRSIVPEMMDDPALDPVAHRQALAGLRRIHWWSGTAKSLAWTLSEIAQRKQLEHIRVLDIGCGGGDVTSQIAVCMASTMACEVVGWDMSPTAVETANAYRSKVQHATSGRCSVDFQVQDILTMQATDKPSSKDFDFVICSLFLHHFQDREAFAIMKRMLGLARHAIVIDDLIRSRFGYTLAILGCHLLSRSRIVHFDGPQSVRAAFKPQEILAMASEAGARNGRIRNLWPARFQFVAEPPK
jgi:2-polyprenyl-3-methyl-5-hydroxy-6-metoxy-1,4-benzoquinol methylase